MDYIDYYYTKEKYKEFMEDMDIKAILEDFFRKGFSAGMFLNDTTKKPLRDPKDILKSKFDKGNYRYLIMRVPLSYYQEQEMAKQQVQQQSIYPQEKKHLTPQQYQDVLRQLEIQRAMPRPERGKVGGKSKYLPKTMKPATKEQTEAKLEMARNLFKDKPIEKELADEECK
jgi:hypothetical protein